MHLENDMVTVINSSQLIGMTLISVALLGTLIGVLMQFMSEVQRPELRFVSHDFDLAGVKLTTQIAVESRFDVTQNAANSSEKYAA